MFQVHIRHKSPWQEAGGTPGSHWCILHPWKPCMLIPLSVSPKSLQTLLLLKKSPGTAQCQGTRVRQDYLCQYTDVSLGFTHCAFPCGSYSYLSFFTPHYFLIIQFVLLFIYFFTPCLCTMVRFDSLSAAKCAQNSSGFFDCSPLPGRHK